MQEKKDSPSLPYTFCDIYRFAGDKVAELSSFVIRTDKARTGDRTANDAAQMASAGKTDYTRSKDCRSTHAMFSALTQDVSARLKRSNAPACSNVYSASGRSPPPICAVTVTRTRVGGSFRR